jgi:hypothetical protein
MDLRLGEAERLRDMERLEPREAERLRMLLRLGEAERARMDLRLGEAARRLGDIDLRLGEAERRLGDLERATRVAIFTITKKIKRIFFIFFFDFDLIDSLVQYFQKKESNKDFFFSFRIFSTNS